jgi:hypothetical protein
MQTFTLVHDERARVVEVGSVDELARVVWRLTTTDRDECRRIAHEAWRGRVVLHAATRTWVCQGEVA